MSSAVRYVFAGQSRVFEKFFFLMLRPPPRSTLFPYTTLSDLGQRDRERAAFRAFFDMLSQRPWMEDRKSTRLNSSHVRISYAVFCLKKKTRRLRVLKIRSSSASNVFYSRDRKIIYCAMP